MSLIDIARRRERSEQVKLAHSCNIVLLQLGIDGSQANQCPHRLTSTQDEVVDV